MKKCLFYMLLIFCLFLGPVYTRVLAAELEFSVHAEPNVVEAAGERVKLKFMISAGDNIITYCKFSVSNPTGVTFVENESPNGWVINDTDPSIYKLESLDGVSQGVIMNSIFEVNNDSTINVTNISCVAEDDTKFENIPDVSVDVKIADTVNVKVDGVSVGGMVTNPLSPTKSSFVLAVTSADSSIQSNVSVEVADTTAGSNKICSGEECKEIVVNFSSENFCDSAECKTLKPKLGDHVLIKVYIGNTEDKKFYVIKELSDEPALDGSLKYLKVWGQEIELKEGEREYTIKAPANATDYTVVAELSDSNNFIWDEEDNPSKYNFKTDTVTLILRPKNSEAYGAEERVYVVHIEQDGASSQPPSSSSAPSSSPSSSSVPVTPSSSSNNNGGNISNPQTSGISQFIIAIILFISLGATLSLYKKNMEEYR